MNANLAPVVGMEDEIEAILDRVAWLTDRHQAPGVCLEVQVGDRRYASCSGVRSVRDETPMAPDVRFPMGCIAKSLLALACAELHLEGKLDLHAPVADVLPELSAPAERSAVSLSDLISHTAGYIEPRMRAPFQSLDWGGFVEFFRNRGDGFQPGAVWSYNQTGHAIVARVLERVVGLPALNYLKAHFLDPLGIGPASVDSPESHLKTCATFHIFSTATRRYEPVRAPQISSLFRETISYLPLSVPELLTLGRAMNDGFLAGRNPTAIALARAPSIAIPPQISSPGAEITPDAYGLGLGRYGEFWGLIGSYVGSTCAVRAHPERHVVIAIGMNAWAPGVRDRLLSRLMAATGGYAPSHGPHAAPCDLTPWIGDYQGASLGSGDLTVSPREEGVLCVMRQAQGERQITVTPAPDGTCRISSPIPQTVGFHREPGSERPYVRLGGNAYQRIASC